MQPEGYCECECGGKTEIATRTDASCGWVKGKPKRFIFNHHRRKRASSYYTEQDLGYTSPCWVWTGTTRDGYGRIGRDGRLWNAHVWYYVQVHGPVPDGLEVDHLCHQNCVGGSTCPHRACVNPDHLEAVPKIVNNRRGVKSRPQKTHCKHGHEFTPENTIRRADGTRKCRVCQNRMMLAYYYRRKADQK